MIKKNLINMALGLSFLAISSSYVNAEVITTKTITGYKPIGEPLLVSEVEGCRQKCVDTDYCVRYLIKKYTDGQVNCILTQAQPDFIYDLDSNEYEYYDYSR